jgi:hypothetical protein
MIAQFWRSDSSLEQMNNAQEEFGDGLILYSLSILWCSLFPDQIATIVKHQVSQHSILDPNGSRNVNILEIL